MSLFQWENSDKGHYHLNGTAKDSMQKTAYTPTHPFTYKSTEKLPTHLIGLNS